MSKFLLVLDPGHGGTDPGATGNGLVEKVLTLEICKLADKYIAKNYPEIECQLTRYKDTFVELKDRTIYANGRKADALISVHINSAGDSAANGFESFVYTTDGEGSKSVALQKKLHFTLARLWTSKGRKDRGQKKANFHMVREFKGAAVLLEFGFVVNKKDAELLKQQAFLQANAEALADAAAAYFGVTKSVTLPGKPEGSAGVYRVHVDGKQIAAYSHIPNLVAEVEKAAKAGKKEVKLELVK